MIHADLQLQSASQMGLQVGAMPSLLAHWEKAWRDTGFMLSVKDRTLVTNMDEHTEKGQNSVPHCT